MSYDLSVASRFALPQFTSEPVLSTEEEELAGALGLFDGLTASQGVASDTFTMSDALATSVLVSAAVADSFIMTDTGDGEAFSKSDYRHTENVVWLDDAITLVWIMD